MAKRTKEATSIVINLLLTPIHTEYCVGSVSQVQGASDVD